MSDDTFYELQIIGISLKKSERNSTQKKIGKNWFEA